MKSLGYWWRKLLNRFSRWDKLTVEDHVRESQPWQLLAGPFRLGQKIRAKGYLDGCGGSSEWIAPHVAAGEIVTVCDLDAIHRSIVYFEGEKPGDFLRVRKADGHETIWYDAADFEMVKP